MRNFLILLLATASCATADNFADLVMPDEFGIGNSFMSGNYKGWGHGDSFGHDRASNTQERWNDGGSLDGNITSAWFVWKLPSYADRDVSVHDFRRNIVRDYQGYEEPEDSIIAVEIDPETGSKSYSFGPGFYGSMLTLITLVGLGAAKIKGSFSGSGTSSDSSDVA